MKDTRKSLHTNILKARALESINWVFDRIDCDGFMPLDDAKFFYLEDREGILKTTFVQRYMMLVGGSSGTFSGNKLWTTYITMTIEESGNGNKFGGAIEFSPSNFFGITRSINMDALTENKDDIITQQIFIKDLLNNYD